MGKAWEDLINIGIVYPKVFGNITGGDEFFHNLFKILEDPFFTVVELSYVNDVETAKKAKFYGDKAGVSIIFNGGEAFRNLKIDLSTLDENLRQESIGKARAMVDLSYAMGAKIFHIVSGKYTGEKDLNPMTEVFIDSIEQICAYARAQGKDYELMISLETGDRHFHRKYLFGPTDEAVALALRVRENHRNFGILLDQGHLPLLEEDPHKALKIAGDFLTHIHLGNSYKKDPAAFYFGDKHLPFGVPDSEVGITQLREFLQTLSNIGFLTSPGPLGKPTLTFEVGPMEEERPELVIANVKRAFYEAWQGVEVERL